MNYFGRNISRMLSAAALAVAGLTAGATQSLAQEVTLSFHHFLPPQASAAKNMLVPWMKKVEAESDGRIKFNHFPSMQLGGKPPELYQQVVDGVADVVWVLPGYTPGRFSRTEVFELPFIMTDAVATSRAFWRLAEETMLDQDFAETKVLALWVHGAGVIHSKDPIRKVSDLNGVKLRAPTQVTSQMFSSLGATAVGMPVPSVTEALSKGVIDGTVIPWEVTSALKTSELVTNHTEFPTDSLYTATLAVVMNRQKYDSLPDDLKAVLDANSGLVFSEFAAVEGLKADIGPREAAVEMGNDIIVLSEEEVAEWKTASEPTISAWIEAMDSKGKDGTGLYARALELIAEESAK